MPRLKRDLYIYFMSHKYKFRDNDKLYFISFAVVYGIDIFYKKELVELSLVIFKYGTSNFFTTIES
jgi:hypothetical protein